MMAYSFGEQKGDGLAHEAELDTYFERFFKVLKMDHDDPSASETQRSMRKAMQSLGVDRVFVHASGIRWTVEYKADTTAATTGNAFIETVSVDTRDKAGWAYTSVAQLLAYYIPPTGRVLLVSVPSLRGQLAEWAEQFPVRQVPNRGYHTHGLLVPLSLLEPLSVWDFTLPSSPLAA